MIETISGIVVPVVIAIFGAAGWASDRSSKHIDRRFTQIAEMVERNEKDIEKVEKELRELEVKLPKEFVLREEFVARMSDGAKKMDYLVEQVDSIKSMLMYGREKA
jgi:1,2-phenylacetyl-CoA epoxidase catalytic subunit